MNDSAAAPLVTSEALRLGIPRLAASCAGHRLHPACSCTTRQSPSFRSRTPGGSRHPRWRWTNYWPVHELDEPSDLTLFQMHMEPHSDFHMAVSSMLHAFQCLSVPFSAFQCLSGPPSRCFQAQETVADRRVPLLHTSGLRPATRWPAMAAGAVARRSVPMAPAR